jgi:tRNA threonylcarbamoyladenosine biosynthesis protein TsaE
MALRMSAAGIEVNSRIFNQTSCSAEETRTLGRRIGESVTDTTIIGLIGDLGCGKTAFVQGLARGLSVPEEYYITSPTFTLINRYPGRLPLFHVDLYRIEDPLEVEDIGLNEILTGRGVVAIEWADRIFGELPAARIEFYFDILTDESRCIKVVGYGDREVRLLDKLEPRLSGSEIRC